MYVWWYSRPWGCRSILPASSGWTHRLIGLPLWFAASVCCRHHPMCPCTCGRGIPGRHGPQKCWSSKAVLHCWPLWLATVPWVCRPILPAVGEPALGMFHKVLSIWYAFIILFICLFIHLFFIFQESSVPWLSCDSLCRPD